MEDKYDGYSLEELEVISNLNREEIEKVLKFVANNDSISDSDVDDFCAENNFSVRKVGRLMFAIAYLGIDCVYCKNNGFAFNMYPCHCCSKNPNLKNYYNPFATPETEM